MTTNELIARIEEIENDREYYIPDGMLGTHDIDNETEQQRTYRVECWGNTFPAELRELCELRDLAASLKIEV